MGSRARGDFGSPRDDQVERQLRSLGFRDVPYDPKHPVFAPWTKPMGLPPSSKDLVAKMIQEGDWDALRVVFELESAQEPLGRRWRCENRWCKSQGDWWISIHATIHCARCTPPSVLGLVAIQGTAENAPHLDIVTGKPLLDSEFRGGNAAFAPTSPQAQP